MPSVRSRYPAPNKVVRDFDSRYPLQYGRQHLVVRRGLIIPGDRSDGLERQGSNPWSTTNYATLAQRVERQPEELGVLGSIPRGGTTNTEAWQSLADCDSLENCRLERVREFKSHRFLQVANASMM